MSLRFVFLASGFLYKILSIPVKRKEKTETALQHLTQNPPVTIKTQHCNKII